MEARGALGARRGRYQRRAGAQRARVLGHVGARSPAGGRGPCQGAWSSVPMDRNFLGPLFLICMCGKVTIVDWVGEVVGICRKFYGLLILLCVCGKFTILLWGFGEG